MICIDNPEGLRSSIALSPIAALISDPRQPGNPIVAANEAFQVLTGYPAEEVIGRNCRFLAGPRTESDLSEKIAASVRQSRPVQVEIINYRRDGSSFRNSVTIAPVFRSDGELVNFVSSQVEIDDGARQRPSARHAAAVRIIDYLSPRQRQVLEHIAAGDRTKQIAFQLSLSEKTVKMHRSLMLEKLGRPSLAGAIRIAIDAGL